MKVSLITVSYNSAATIEDTIKSVLNQTYSDIEYLIIDGGSTDNTIDIVKQYEPKFAGRMRWISEPDNGLYDAMNKGIRMATGDVVGIINSDDFLFDNYVISDIVGCMTSNNVDCVYGNLVFVNSHNTSKIVRTWISSQYKNGAFLKGWHPAHPTFYLRKECYNKYGLYDITFNVSADFELMLRMIEVNHVSNIYINRYFVKMRMGGESTGSIKKIIEGNKNIMRAFKKNGLKNSWFYPIKRLFPKAMNIIKNKIIINK